MVHDKCRGFETKQTRWIQSCLFINLISPRISCPADREFAASGPRGGSSVVSLQTIRNIQPGEELGRDLGRKLCCISLTWIFTKFLSVFSAKENADVDLISSECDECTTTEESTSTHPDEKSEYDSFPATVSYSYTFPEIAFLVFMLNKLLKRKFISKMQRQAEAKLSCEVAEVVSRGRAGNNEGGRKKTVKLSLEKITWLQVDM